MSSKPSVQRSPGIPGLRGTEHVGFTVPDLEEATTFFVDVIGCEYMFELGPFVAEDDWMEKHLNVHPRTVMRRLRFFRCKFGPNFEIFEYEAPDQDLTPPQNSDVGGHHLAFYVDDFDAAFFAQIFKLSFNPVGLPESELGAARTDYQHAAIPTGKPF